MSPAAGSRGSRMVGSCPPRLTPRPSTGDALLDESLRLSDELRRAGLAPRGYSIISPYGGHRHGGVEGEGPQRCPVCGSGLNLPD